MGGRVQVTLIVRAHEQGGAGYLLGKYGGGRACFVTVKTQAEAGRDWRRLTGNLA